MPEGIAELPEGIAEMPEDTSGTLLALPALPEGIAEVPERCRKGAERPEDCRKAVSVFGPRLKTEGTYNIASVGGSVGNGISEKPL